MQLVANNAFLVNCENSSQRRLVLHGDMQVVCFGVSGTSVCVCVCARACVRARARARVHMVASPRGWEIGLHYLWEYVLSFSHSPPRRL